MSNSYKEGEKVKWKWGSGHGSGKIQSRFEKSVTRKIDGSEVTRNGSEDDPAYYIVSEDSGNALKLGSELE